MDIESSIDGEAHQMLAKAGYLWNHLIVGYQRTRQRDQDINEYYASLRVISFEQLDAHHLVARPFGQEQPTLEQKRSGLRWLEERIKTNTLKC
jgi:hypothetical protein